MFINLAYFYNQAYLFLKAIFNPPAFLLVMVQVIWFSLGAIFLILLIIILKKKADLNREDKEDEKVVMDKQVEQIETKETQNWKVVNDYLKSANSSDWKLAILEADKMLDEMVKKMGYNGENLGERLRQVEASDFESLNEAWEAHKVRNLIAHEAGYDVSFKEAKRILSLYEKVFKEFGYI
jgi:hypothetical protein